MGVYNIEPKAHKDIVSSIWPEFQPILHQDSPGDSFHFNNFPVNLSYKSQLSINIEVQGQFCWTPFCLKFYRWSLFLNLFISFLNPLSICNFCFHRALFVFFFLLRMHRLMFVKSLLATKLIVMMKESQTLTKANRWGWSFS